MDDKQISNSKINKLVICLVIMFVLVTGMYIFTNTDTSIDTNANTQNFASNEVINVTEDVIVNKNDDIKEAEGEEIDFYSDEVQNLFPITGAFPTGNLAYITKLRNIEEIDNDFILKAAFSKVTKDDWADSYVREGEELNVNSDVLDEYIKQIFGDIEYKKEDFNNEDIKYDNSTAGIYNIKYNEEENKYYININTGDVDESVIVYLYPKAIKYKDRLEITIHPLYIRNCGEAQDQDGNYSFSYIAYRHYNYESNSFVSRLTDTMNGIYQYNEETDKEEYNKLIQGIQEKDLETYTFIYKLNEDTNSYELKSFNSK